MVRILMLVSCSSGDHLIELRVNFGHEILWVMDVEVIAWWPTLLDQSVEVGGACVVGASGFIVGFKVFDNLSLPMQFLGGDTQALSLPIIDAFLGANHFDVVMLQS
jgi:hypothetical protein